MPYSTSLNRWISRVTTVLKASGAETASTVGAFVDLGDATAAEIDIGVTAVSGTPTLLADIFGSPDGSTLTVTDGVTNTDTSFVSASAGFSSAVHVGWNVWGPGVPANTFIKSVTNGTTVVLNNATTATASGLTVIISNAYKIGTIGSDGAVLGKATDPSTITVVGTYRACLPLAHYARYQSRIGGGTPSLTYSISIDAGQ